MKSNQITYYFLVFVAAVALWACFGFGKDVTLYGKVTFITIFVYSIIKTYVLLIPRDDDEDFSDTPRRVRYFFELSLRTIALPMYLTEVLHKFGLFKEHGSGAVIGSIIVTILYLLVSSPLRETLNLWTSCNILVLAMVGCLNHNYYIGAAGVWFSLAEYMFEEDRFRLDLTPDSVFNIFLSAFTATATVGLLIEDTITK